MSNRIIFPGISEYISDVIDYLHKGVKPVRYSVDGVDSFYVVTLSYIMDGKGKNIVYSYIQYDVIFFYFWFMFLRSRVIQYDNDVFFSVIEKGQYVIVVEDVLFELLGSEYKGIHNYIEVKKKISKIAHYEQIEELKMLNMVGDLNLIKSLITSIFNNDYASYVSILLNNNKKLRGSTDKDFNLFKTTSFVVSNLENFLNKLREFNINGGSQKLRVEVSLSKQFLFLIDLDFRNLVFDFSRHYFPYYRNNVLSRGSFSYNNIRGRSGPVRLYSTTSMQWNKKLNTVRLYSRYATSEVSTTNLSHQGVPLPKRDPKREGGDKNNRQNLFKENYSGIKNIIKNNENLNNFDLQIKIEYFLLNQENKFNLNSESFESIKYNTESYNFVKNKKYDIEKLLSKNMFKYISKRDSKDVYKTWVIKFVFELGIEKISSLLLTYFMEVLMNETVSTEDGYEKPGIPTITAFDRFGGKLVNKYVHKKYWESSLHKSTSGKSKTSTQPDSDRESEKNISLNEFKYRNEKEFEVFEEDTFNAKVGGYFVSCLLEVDLLYQDLDVKVNTPKEKEYYVRVDKEVRSKLISIKNSFLHIPQRLPMVCKPKDYVYSNNIKKNILGGFLLNGQQYTHNMFIDKKGYEHSTRLKDDNVVVDLINGLSKTPYKINKDTLRFINSYGYSKGILIDVKDNKLQNFMIDPYNYSNKTVRNKYRSILSKLNLERNILSIASCYSNVDEIYFPLRLDQRTRIYCDTDYFDYQKNDLAKSLISFARPGIVTKIDNNIINYFKGYGANMFGNDLDKKSLNTKIKWIEGNKEYILNFRNNDIINNAENKACFVSFCFEYERFIEFIEDKNRTTFNTFLPIQLDASCNGYQHLSLLTKETKLFEKLNLQSSKPEDTPSDFYKYILEKTRLYITKEIKIISEMVEKNEKLNKTLNSLKRLIKVGFDRSILKKVIMTKSYNASIPRQVEYLVSQLEEHQTKDDLSKYKSKYYLYKNSNIKILREDILHYVRCITAVLDLETPKIKELSKYLDGIIKICTKLQISVPWMLPSGAVIRQSYKKKEELSIKAFTFLKSRYTFKKYISGSIDLRKQKRATMPNLIHSLDGTTIALLYKDFKELGSLYTVHDCFATTANNVPLLIDILKSVYLEIYSSNDYLLEFDNFVKTVINRQFGDDIFSLSDKYVYIPTSTKTEKIEYPNVKKIIDIKSDDKDKIKNLKYSSYVII